MKEHYNIHNLLSFTIENSIGGISGTSFNPEYKYFRSTKEFENHFHVQFTEDLSNHVQTLSHNNKEWEIGILHLNEQDKLLVGKKKLTIAERLTFYIRQKNLYIRSLISTKLLKANASLVHSAAFFVNGTSTILAGRPGVFKTSILMDAIRHYGGQFIGEENSLIHNGLVYPFPLNIDSISYKIKNYKDENPSGKIQKILLGLNLIFRRKKMIFSLELPEPSKICNVCYLIKGEEFGIEKVSLDEIMPDLIENEVLELSIPPTHTLSGINYNFFCETLSKHNSNFINSFKDKLEEVFLENFSGCSTYRITSPKEYTQEITEQILNTLSKNEK